MFEVADERFVVLRSLGAGTSGQVLEAWDRLRDAPVALKRLARLEPAALHRFKQAFRALADVGHPNLVALHDLFTLDGDWCFTMERVVGADFLAWTRPGGALDEARLRDALAQLVAAVGALHAAGLLHRDLKPSNVLVEQATGRVVVLDFGLVAALGAGGAMEAFDARVSGTPAYMAPEQATGLPVTPAADWYAVGVMLYEALTGALPFDGSAAEAMARKAAEPAPEVPAGAPADLAALAAALLQRTPGARPDGAMVAAAVGAAPGGRTARGGAFVGRAAALATLEGALDDLEAEMPRVILVHGPSGMGKSTLLSRFGALAAHAGAVVLAARCHEREAVPFKALDGLVDELTRHLRALGADEVRARLPRDVGALARVFPVLRQLPGVADAPAPPAHADPHEQRRRAFGALRELLARIGDRAPLVLLLDDLQWGDLDSAAALGELLLPPEPPLLLLVASFRSESASAPVVRALRDGPWADALEIAVGPLDLDESRALALAEGADEQAAVVVAREAGGSPFFIGELVRAGPVPVHDVIAARVARLPDAARRLLETVAAAGGPLGRAAARRAADLSGEDEAASLTVLRRERLVRSGEGDAVETSHDRVREAVIAGLSPERRAQVHAGLAAALEREADPEWSAHHFRAAGDRASARHYTERAAERAMVAFAFERAAALFRDALELGDDPRPWPLWVRLAEALSCSGRGPEAAAWFLRAATDAPELQALDLTRRAAQHLLRSGHVDEGLEVVRPVLEALDLAPPRKHLVAMAALVVNRARVLGRGFDFAERPAADLGARERLRIDVCWTMGNGLGGVDLVQGGEFQGRHMLLALEAGEPYRVARALAWEAVISALEGPTGAARAEECCRRALAIADRIGHPHAKAWGLAASVVGHWCEGRWRQADAICAEAAAAFRACHEDIAWELGSLHAWWSLPALFYLGEARALRDRAPAAAAEFARRGDRYALTTLRTYVAPLIHLLDGRPDEARRESAEAIAAWSRHSSGWHLQHWCDLVAQCQADVYEGDSKAALDRIARRWVAIVHAQGHRSRIVRIVTGDLAARAALVAARRHPRYRRRVAEEAERLERESTPWADALARCLRGGLAAFRGEVAAARAAYADAVAAFGALEMPLHAAAAALRRDELAGEPPDLRPFDDRGVADPRRFADLLAPGPESRRD